MSTLSSQQQEIVHSNEKVMMVIAGPGSGKTHVLTQKVIRAIKEGVPEPAILLLTFTNKAANNMLERIEKQTGRTPALLGGTFHHVANVFVRQNAGLLGYSKNYSIIDEADSARLIRKVLREEHSDKAKRLPKPEQLQKMFSFCRNSMSSISDYLEASLKGYRREALAITAVYDSYTARKRKGNMLDFDDLLELFNKLLDNQSFREKITSQYTHIFIDEFQDTNKLQFEIVKKLHKDGNHLFVVGDDCQSIYSFRAAEILNMLRFQAVFKSAKVFYLTENYRSTEPIISLINGIISRNRNKFDKTLHVAGNAKAGNLPQVIIYKDARDEAHGVAQRISSLIRSGVKPEEVAVLYRSNFQSAHVEVELAKAGVKYAKLGGIKFFEQSHIKDVTAFLKIISGMLDELAWERVLRLFEGVGEKKAKNIFSKAVLSPEPLAELKSMREKKLSALLRLVGLCEKKDTPAQKAKVFTDEFYTPYLKKKYDDFEDRLADISQLISILHSYNSVEEFLEDAMLDTNLADPKDMAGRVVISTIHQAKGLEWDNVLVIGVANGRFPSRHSLEDMPKLEEERRLFYVACSRAKRNLWITVPLRDNSGWGGIQDLEVSQFICEQPDGRFIITHDMNRPGTGSKGNPTCYPGFVTADTLI
ncbi:MAG: ATP-dependent helicase [Candidatus Micrarchaeota archaeon]|nr:ATP-dependent helicase [Candidatus Micrarchaeota archaeon]